MKNDSNNPVEFLRRENRARWWRMPLWLAALGLAGALLAVWFFQHDLSLKPSRLALSLWGACLGVTFLVASFVFWMQRKNLTTLARGVDEKFSTKNRLEAAAELASLNSPLAVAQRDETAVLVGSMHRPNRAFALVPASLATLLLLANAWFGASWMLHREPVPPVAKAPPETSPTASIHWKTPKPETKATKIEEVPLEAAAESSSGLAGMSLEIAVNGEPKKSIPLPAQPFDQAGPHPVKVSMYFDELEVEPLDIVSYYLKANRKARTTLAPTTSELQFVEVRPFREDAVEKPPGGGKGEALLPIITMLKVAQLGLMKQNFVLTNSELAREVGTWKIENARVGGEQSTLAQKTEEAVQKMIAEGAPADVVDLLTQAKPRMESASQLIAQIANAKASPEQGRALALITACEKNVLKTLSKNKGQGKPPKVTDPFKDEQKFELPPRAETAAGELEKAAQEQEKLLAELNKPDQPGSEKADAPEPGEKGSPDKSGSADKPGEGEKGQGKGKGDGKGEGQGDGQGKGQGSGSGSLAQKQQEIADTLNKLKNDPQFAEEIKKAIAAAQKAAEESKHQLDANDSAAAKEPAARTMANLQTALGSMKAASDRESEAALAKAQRELNEAAEMVKNPESDSKKNAPKTAELTAKARDEIRAEAERQQEHGSAMTAADLAKLAKEFEEKKVLDDLKKLAGGQGDDPAKVGAKIDELAQRTAAAQLALAQGREGLEKMVAELKRGAANLEHLVEPERGSAADRLALQKELIGDIQAAAQKAEVGMASSGGKDAARELLATISRTKGIDSTTTNVRRDLRVLSKPITDLIDLLTAELTEVRRQEVIVQFHPEDAPPAYRKSVADYFERLSRDYKKSEPSGEPEPK